MGKTYFKLDGALELVAGWDRPFGTWFAQLYDANFSEQTQDDSPAKTVGYHPTEQALSHAKTEHGPYPMPTYTALQTFLIGEWGIDVTPEMRQKIKETQ